MLLLSPYILTFYPVAYPATTGPLVLQSDTHYLDASAPLAGALEQVIQRADYYRASTPDFYSRGNQSLTLDWEETRFIDGPAAAMTTAIDLLETLPVPTGWLHVSIPGTGRAWAISPCAISSSGWRHQPRAGQSDILRLRWHIAAGGITTLS